jgi:endonuclease/exonuclease/phosphatase family metal-dependent hydrolase
MRVATFNVQNLRLRRVGGDKRFDGARDEDAPGESGADAAALDPADRMLTARLIAEADADVIALQEVFDQETLDHFHGALLAPLGASYPHRVCLEGNDGRSQDVALLSRVPLEFVRSHAALTFADIGAPAPAGVSPHARVFRRDCLAARCGPLRLFVCHFKAGERTDPASRVIRRAEALAVRHVVGRSVPDPAAGLWLALGDFNAHDAAGVDDLAALTHGFAIDLSARIPDAERWTYFQTHDAVYSCPDRLFASPALARKCPAARPQILRMGMSRSASAYDGPRYAEVGERRPRASDHAFIMIDLDL